MQSLFDITPLPETSKSNEWYTPSKYIEAARSVMGSIDLDPASCELANRTVKATQYYTKEDNGLALPWYGNIWCNPPYSDPLPWINRFCTSCFNHGILLVNASTADSWFPPLWSYLICFKEKRTKFYNPSKHNITSPRNPSVFIYKGPREQRFIDIFSQFGTIARRVSQPKQASHVQRELDII